MRLLAIAIYLLAGVLAWGQVEMVRTVQMRKLEYLVGDWKVKARLLEPAELKGVGFDGTVHVSWALNHTALEFRAEGLPNVEGGHKMEAMGVLAYNEADFVEKQGFTASFAWSEDGRMLPVKGKFSGKTLVLEGQPTGSEPPAIRIRLNTEAQPVSIGVYSYGKDGHGKATEFKFMDLTFTKV